MFFFPSGRSGWLLGEAAADIPNRLERACQSWAFRGTYAAYQLVCPRAWDGRSTPIGRPAGRWERWPSRRATVKAGWNIEDSVVVEEDQ